MWKAIQSQLDADGVAVLDSCLDDTTTRRLIDAFDEADADAPLVRRGVVFARRNLLASPAVRDFIDGDEVRAVLAALAPGHVAVRGILFDKTGDANWTVPWHQDRSIAVAERRDTPGFGPWSIKAGVVHVQPPTDVLRAMLTLRFSLDPCGPDNGPLRAIPGTHRTLLSPTEIDAAVDRPDERLCTTAAGGVVIMRPLLLHASSPATHATRRRVLHLEFAPPQLPGRLAWALA